MAPELLTKGDVSTKCDVYSYAIILWEMLSSSHPFKGLDIFQVRNYFQFHDGFPHCENFCVVTGTTHMYMVPVSNCVWTTIYYSHTVRPNRSWKPLRPGEDHLFPQGEYHQNSGSSSRPAGHRTRLSGPALRKSLVPLTRQPSRDHGVECCKKPTSRLCFSQMWQPLGKAIKMLSLHRSIEPLHMSPATGNNNILFKTSMITQSD